MIYLMSKTVGVAVSLAGGLLILIGIGLGFVPSGECGSVFQPRDEFAADVNRMWDQLHGGSGVDVCATAMDLTVPVWGLIILGGVVLVTGGVLVWNAYETADSQDEIPSANA